MRLLIVDDSVEIRMLLYATAEYSGFEPLLAEDGDEAIELFDQFDDIALVLTEIFLPRVDGMTLARHIRKTPRPVHIPIVFITSINADQQLAEFLEIGDDIILKPFSQTIILAKLAAHRRLVEMHRKLSEQNQALVKFQKTTEAEHFVASDVIDRSMKGGVIALPGITFFTTPMSDFNGDSVVIARNRSGSAYFMVVDVSGHGLPAAMGTVPLIESFLAHAWNASGVGALAGLLNRVFREKMPDYLLAAVLLGEISPEGDRIQLWNGGMPPAMILAPDGRVQEVLHSAHMPLGALLPRDFSEASVQLRLAPGEHLLCFSDGVTEARNPDGRMFGLDGIRQGLTGRCENPGVVNCLAQVLEDFRGETAPSDDITLLCYRSQGPLPALEVRPAAVEPPVALPLCVQFTLYKPQFEDPRALPALLAVLKSHPAIAPRFSQLGVVMSELVSNAIDHGLLGLSSRLKDEPEGLLIYHEERLKRLDALDDQATLCIEAQIEQGHVLVVTLTDSGPGFDHASPQADGDPDSLHGRGLGIVSHLVQRLEYLGRGNVVRFELPLA